MTWATTRSGCLPPRRDRYKHEVRLFVDKVSKAARDIHAAFYECSCTGHRDSARISSESAQDEHEGNLWERAGLYAYEGLSYVQQPKARRSKVRQKRQSSACARSFRKPPEKLLLRISAVLHAITRYDIAKCPFEKEALIARTGHQGAGLLKCSGDTVDTFMPEYSVTHPGLLQKPLIDPPVDPGP